MAEGHMKSEVAQRKAVVQRFLRRANEYAEEMLARYGQQRAAAKSSMQALEAEEKVARWMSYRAFNDFTIAELETPELDHWFVD